MGRPPVLPSVEVLVELRKQGKRYIDIAEEYGVDVSAVQKKLRRGGAVGELVTYRDVVPWDVDPILADTQIMRILRSIAKQRQGIELKPEQERQLEEWMHMLHEHNLVLDYSSKAIGPEYVNDASPKYGGWHYRTAVPEDEDFYRKPEINKMLAERQKQAERRYRTA